MAQSHIYRPFTWQAWHLWYWVAPLGRDLSPGRRATLRGRRGTKRHPPWYHVAGVAQSHIYRRFAWQAWHLWYWVAPLGRDLSPGRRATLRGRRGTKRHPPWYHVAGVAQSHFYCRFAWQAWHLWYWVAPLGRDLSPGRRATLRAAWHNLTSTLISRGRRGTISHLPSFCVAGVALMVLGGALGPGFVAWAPRHFAWQAWHNLTSTLISRGRRGTISLLLSFCVAGVALMVLGGALGPGFVAWAPRHFAWQAWHNLTSTFVSRGRRGTISHLPSFCVAGVAPLKLILGRSWLVGLSGPLIFSCLYLCFMLFFFAKCIPCISLLNGFGVLLGSCWSPKLVVKRVPLLNGTGCLVESCWSLKTLRKCTQILHFSWTKGQHLVVKFDHACAFHL